MISELWTPPGVTHTGVPPVGRNVDTTSLIYEYRFNVHDDVTERDHNFRVLIDEDTSKSHLEEMVGNAMESWLIDVRLKHNKPAPTPEQKKEIGKILNDIRIRRDKRGESSTGVIHFKGLK